MQTQETAQNTAFLAGPLLFGCMELRGATVAFHRNQARAAFDRTNQTVHDAYKRADVPSASSRQSHR